MREVANQQQGLYRPEFEHDNCGIGAVVNIKGKKTHDTVANALKIVENLEHRAGRMQKEKPVMVSVSFFRSPTNFLRRSVKKKALISAERENTV